MNPLYQQLTSQPAQVTSGGPMFANPMQKMNYIMQAMTNPAAFVRNRFPDIPQDISNNPAQILQYLQRTRGISDQQIQQLYGMYGGR